MIMEAKPMEENYYLDFRTPPRPIALNQEQPSPLHGASIVTPAYSDPNKNSRKKFLIFLVGLSSICLIIILSLTLSVTFRNQKVWGQWNTWTACDRPCGFGTQHRNRSCNKDQACSKNNTSTRPCVNISVCPRWSSWSKWGFCSRTCDAGQQERTRYCAENETVSYGCQGSSRETKACAKLPGCSGFNSWTSWSSCTKTCGSDQQVRTRTCKRGHGCHGPKKETKICNIKPVCPKWTKWNDWGFCGKTCGLSQISRSRTCLQGGTDSGLCDGPDRNIKSCPALPPCPR